MFTVYYVVPYPYVCTLVVKLSGRKVNSHTILGTIQEARHSIRGHFQGKCICSVKGKTVPLWCSLMLNYQLKILGDESMTPVDHHDEFTRFYFSIALFIDRSTAYHVLFTEYTLTVCSPISTSPIRAWLWASTCSNVISLSGWPFLFPATRKQTYQHF